MNIVTWYKPPGETLGCPAPIPQLVTRTEHTMVALQHVIAFQEGCSLILHLAVRRGSLDESVWKNVLASNSGSDPRLASAGGDLRFTVRFPDGSKATTVDNALRGWAHPVDPPEPPVLVEIGSESSSNEQFFEGDRRLWLWPLPPPSAFEFIIEWQSVGLDPATTTLDGSAIARAAEQAQPYWP